MVCFLLLISYCLKYIDSEIWNVHVLFIFIVSQYNLIDLSILILLEHRVAPLLDPSTQHWHVLTRPAHVIPAAVSLSSVCLQSVFSLSSVCLQSVFSLSSVCFQSVFSLSSVCLQFVFSLFSTLLSPSLLRSNYF